MEIKRIIGIVAVASLLACNQSSNSVKETKDSVTKVTATAVPVTVSFNDAQLQKIYTSYLGVKDALVATKIDLAQTAAKDLAEELKNYNGCENTAVTANKIAGAKDIVSQRKDFTALSTDVIALFKHADLKSGIIFVQHCPMANKGDGGDWLSSQQKIQNPYYGSEMMECGAVVEEIKAK